MTIILLSSLRSFFHPTYVLCRVFWSNHFFRPNWKYEKQLIQPKISLVCLYLIYVKIARVYGLLQAITGLGSSIILIDNSNFRKNWYRSGYIAIIITQNILYCNISHPQYNRNEFEHSDIIYNSISTIQYDLHIAYDIILDFDLNCSHGCNYYNYYDAFQNDALLFIENKMIDKCIHWQYFQWF